MGRRSTKGEYLRKSFETMRPGKSSESNEPYAALYVTMLTSEAWQNLTHGARSLYTYMKLQYRSKQNQAAGLAPEQFYFNRAMYKKLGFTNPSQFTKWRNELVDGGFITVYDHGRNMSKAVYEFSDRWQRK